MTKADTSASPAETSSEHFDVLIVGAGISGIGGLHLLCVGSDFYGSFAANTTPDTRNFPNGVRYQRNARFGTRRLLDVDNVSRVPNSIDPFFFKVTG